MVRENLIAALRNAAAELGYTASFSEKLLNATRTCGFPLMYVEPLKVISTSGSRDCRVAYRVKTKLLVLPDASGAASEEVWQALERDAIALFKTLDNAPWIEAVRDMGCSPCATPQTPLGDTALEVEFTVVMFYCV